MYTAEKTGDGNVSEEVRRKCYQKRFGKEERYQTEKVWKYGRETEREVEERTDGRKEKEQKTKGRNNTRKGREDGEQKE